MTLNTLGAQSLVVTDTATGSITGSTGVAVSPKAPTNLTAKAVSRNQIDLTWTDNSNNETGFLIERSLDGVRWTLVASVGADVTSYHDIGLSRKTRYYYRVRATSTAVNPAVFSVYSNVANATTLH